MTKTNRFGVSIMLIVFAAGAAAAQTAPSAESAGPAAAVPSSAGPPGPAATAPSPAASGDAARAACTAALNADPKFAAEIIKVADDRASQQRDLDTIAAHTDANLHVQKNQQHVIYAYAAMWIVAAGFVIFLWRRQEALKSEIAGLRRELDAASDPSAKGLT
jgi:hypothetical protein